MMALLTVSDSLQHTDAVLPPTSQCSTLCPPLVGGRAGARRPHLRTACNVEAADVAVVGGQPVRLHVRAVHGAHLVTPHPPGAVGAPKQTRPEGDLGAPPSLCTVGRCLPSSSLVIHGRSRSTVQNAKAIQISKRPIVRSFRDKSFKGI